MKDGGSAFPIPGFEGVKEWQSDWDMRPARPISGMSLRDWFAGQALSKLLEGDLSLSDTSREYIARQAYEFADAMLLERSKNGREG